MADGKWISDLTAATPVADAARRVLTVRLEAVRDNLRLALTAPLDDIEHVHQLRVSTRRATAAVDIFADCLPARVHRQARKKLRRLRRAAGQARDWDVFAADLAEIPRPSAAQQPGLDFLAGYACGQRRASQAHLEQAACNFPFDFERFMAETVAAIHKPHLHPAVHTLHALAQPMLARLRAELVQAVDRDLGDYEHLHQVRIIGKRLRYAMEVFADCFPGEFRTLLYPAIEEMQEILGQANDSHVAGQRLREVKELLRPLPSAQRKRFRPGIDRAARFHQQRLARQTKRFLDWCKRWREQAPCWERMGLGTQGIPGDGPSGADRPGRGGGGGGGEVDGAPAGGGSGRGADCIGSAAGGAGGNGSKP
jgi:CHAD domain-containing protein